MKNITKSLKGIVVGAALSFFVATGAYAYAPHKEFKEIYESKESCSEIEEKEIEIKNVRIQEYLNGYEKIGKDPITLEGLTPTSDLSRAKLADEIEAGKKDEYFTDMIKGAYKIAEEHGQKPEKTLEECIEEMLPLIKNRTIFDLRHDVLNLYLPKDVYDKIEKQVEGDELKGYFDIKGTLKCVDMEEVDKRCEEARKLQDKEKDYEAFLDKVPWENILYWDILVKTPRYIGEELPFILYLELSEINKIKDLE